MTAYTIGKPHRSGWFDTLEVESSGLFRLNAWTAGDTDELLDVTLVLDGREISPTRWYRTYRPDIAKLLNLSDFFKGVAIEYVVPLRSSQQVNEIRVRFRAKDIFKARIYLKITVPAYSSLFGEPLVLRRDQIYGSGPPATEVSEEVLSLAKQLRGPILDFGCGAGALIRELRAWGTEVHGIELRRPEIVDSLPVDLRPYVTLYDGQLPTRFPNKSFRSVVLVEVLEHIRDYEDTISEVARLASDEVLVTVPDISAVPLCFAHHVVPWHLLELTHVNFFTHESLSAVLKKYFRTVDIAKIGPVQVNGTRFFTSIAARCRTLV